MVSPDMAPDPIRRIDVFGYELHYAHGTYVMSGGRAAEAQPSTLAAGLQVPPEATR